MNFELSQEQKLLCDTIFQVANKLERSQPIDERWKRLAETGIIGTCVPHCIQNKSNVPSVN